MLSIAEFASLAGTVLLLTAQTPARMRGGVSEQALQRDERSGDIAGVASNPAGG